MAFFVFQVSDQSSYGKQRTAREVFDFLVRDRSAWGFGPNTPNRKAIKIGDDVLFYLTGSKNQIFTGRATLKSEPYIDESGESNDWFISDSDTLRIDLENVELFDEPKHRKSFATIQWVPAQGGSSKISERDFNVIIGSEPDVLTTTADIAEEEMAYALEKHLEEFIVENWQKIDFGQKLELYQDENGNTGQQYYTEEVGYIDLLARNKKGDFIVIELKKGRNNDQVIGQVLRYMGWVRKNLAQGGQEVHGYIIVGERDPKLSYALSELEAKVSAMVYQISFKLNAF